MGLRLDDLLAGVGRGAQTFGNLLREDELRKLDQAERTAETKRAQLESDRDFRHRERVQTHRESQDAIVPEVSPSQALEVSPSQALKDAIAQSILSDPELLGAAARKQVGLSESKLLPKPSPKPDRGAFDIVGDFNKARTGVDIANQRERTNLFQTTGSGEGAVLRTFNPGSAFSQSALGAARPSVDSALTALSGEFPNLRSSLLSGVGGQTGAARQFPPERMAEAFRVASKQFAGFDKLNPAEQEEIVIGILSGKVPVR